MSKLPPVEVSTKRFIAKEYLIRDSKSVGGAVIINNDTWCHKDVFPYRTGSENDVENLKKALQNVGISKIEEIKNKNKKEIKEKLNKIARDPIYTTGADVFMCFVLSYGGNGYFYDTEEDKVYLSDIMKIFNAVYCPGLVLKPKIFIMQACDKADVKIEDRAHFAGEKNPGDLVTHPQEADFLTYTSTVSGKFNWDEQEEKEQKKTYFIDRICWYLTDHIKKINNKEIDIIKLTIGVNSLMVQYLKELQKKQSRDFDLPFCTIQLTKKLILNKTYRSSTRLAEPQQVSQNLNKTYRASTRPTDYQQDLQGLNKTYRTLTRLTGPQQDLQNLNKTYRTSTRLTDPQQDLQNLNKTYRSSTRLTEPQQDLQILNKTYRTSTRLTDPQQDFQNLNKTNRASTGLTEPQQVLQNLNKTYKTSTRLTEPQHVLQNLNKTYRTSKRPSAIFGSLFSWKDGEGTYFINRICQFLKLDGLFSWKDGEGTYFINRICQFLKQDGELHFKNLPLEVNASMVEFFEKLKQRNVKDLELPLCTSTLTKQLLLGKKEVLCPPVIFLSLLFAIVAISFAVMKLTR